MFTVTLVLAVFPATSVAVPVTIWLALSAVTATVAAQNATPLSASEQVKLTVTAELFQPFASGGGLIAAKMFGGVLSRFTATEAVAAFPALSVAVPETDRKSTRLNSSHT